MKSKNFIAINSTKFDQLFKEMKPKKEKYKLRSESEQFMEKEKLQSVMVEHNSSNLNSDIPELTSYLI